MQHSRSLGRASLLALSLLSACAAADPLSGSTRAIADRPSGADANFLVGHFAELQSDPAVAASAFSRALAERPHDPELIQQTFVAALLAGRPEAAQLARQLPDNQIARLLLVDQDVHDGRWQAAEERLNAMPRQGLTQLLQPLLLAWTQAGAGKTGAALATLRPMLDGQRFRGIFALHAAMIADAAGRPADAAKFYAVANGEMPDLNLRLAQVMASWQVRSGHAAVAERMLADFVAGAPDMAIALPGMLGAVNERPVATPAQGIAEAYLELAGALRGEDSDDLATIMLRLSLDLRPDFTAARLLSAEILSDQQHNSEALRALASVPENDPLAPVVGMRRAQLMAQMGHSTEALHELTRLAAAYPASPLPAIEEGDVYSGKQNYRGAIAAYTHAIEQMSPMHRTDWPVFYQRGIAYDQIHEWPKAEADFRAALKLVPNQPSVLNYLGYTWANKDEHLAEAREMIQKAAAGRPQDGAIIDSLGWVMLRQGETAQAVAMLQRAVELEPEDSTINAHLGDAYAAAGRKLEAEYQWRRALTLNPTADDATKLEAKLQLPKGGAVLSGQ